MSHTCLLFRHWHDMPVCSGRGINLRYDSTLSKEQGHGIAPCPIGLAERILGAAAGVKHAEGTAAIAPYQHHRVLSFRNIGEGFLDIGSALRRATVHADDNLSWLESSFLGGAAGLDALNDRSLQVFRGLQLLADLRGQVGDADSPARLAVIAIRGNLVLAVAAAHLFESYRDVDVLPIAHDFERDLGPGMLLSDFHLQLSGVSDLPSVELGDHVADFQASLGTRRVRLDFGDDRAIRVLHVEELGVLRRDVRDTYPNVGVHDIAAANQRLDRGLHDLGWNGKAHARERSGRRDEKGVDPDHFAMRVDQRAARVAGVDGGIGLDELSGLAGVIGVRIGAIQGADNSPGDGEAESDRITESQHSLPGLELGRVAQRDIGEVAAFDLDDREIGKRIGADQFSGQNAAIAEGNLDVGGTVHNVVVGDDVSVGRDDDAASDAVCKLRLLRHLSALAELVLEVLLHPFRHSLRPTFSDLLLLHLGGDGDVDDGRSDASSA